LERLDGYKSISNDKRGTKKEESYAEEESLYKQ